ncbi:MAG: efflux RND transporter permease subunit [Bacteroidota bacterium]
MNGAIAWMTRHKVAANLLMLTILAVGFASLTRIKQETMPETALDVIQVQVSYPGASPEEVEEGIVQRIEEQIEGVEGVKRVSSVASENLGVVTAELQAGTDLTRALDDIKAEVDRITSFPDGAEKPVVRQIATPGQVLQIALYGDVPERTLKELAAAIKDDLTAIEDISLVELVGTRPYELSIEVSEATLRAYGLTLLDVANVVRRGSLDLPGGSVATDSEEILIRTKGQNYTQQDFEDIVVLSGTDGTQVRLGEIATVRDGFQDVDLITRFNGENAVFVRVSRVGDERTLDISDHVQAYLETELAPTLPAGVSYRVWQDQSQVLRSRLNLLMRNGLQGLLLVVIALMLFLNTRLAFWTSVGIFLSFMGAFGIMIWLDISINMISLFGFLLAIGIVVDDAIVVGENIIAEREKGLPPLQAALKGATRVAGPVTFAVLTTMTAFLPLLFLPGTIGKLIANVPVIVIAVLVLSLVEVLFILPNHLSHQESPRRNAVTRGIERAQQVVMRGLSRFVNGPLERAVRFSVRRYGVVLATGIALLTISIALVLGGYVKFSFSPDVEGDVVNAQLALKPGTPIAQTEELALLLEAKGREAAAQLQQTLDPDDPTLIQNVFVSVGTQQGGADAGLQSHLAQVSIELAASEARNLPAQVFVDAWREQVGEVAGAQRLTFASDVIGFGKPVDVALTADDPAVLRDAVEALKAELQTFAGVSDVADDEEAGKQEVQIDVLPQAHTLGLTLDDIARQVRAAYFGEEALRVQRGRDEVRAYVRLPEDERNALGDLNQYRIRTPQGAAVPLYEVATLRTGIAPVSINRSQGRRVIAVTAEVDPAIATGNDVNAQLQATVIPALLEAFPGVSVSFEGEQREQAETLGALALYFPLALFVIYVLLAIPFGSYVQPLVIMAAIPFGLIGALIGHLLFGLQLGVLSVSGLIGLSGVVVNDSLVLIDFINEQRKNGMPMQEAIVVGAKMRFRPVMLTTLTTFLGVLPIILERSVQAQFLIPMAVSLGFGILFTTFVILLLVPALTMLQHDVVARFTRSRAGGAAVETIADPAANGAITAVPAEAR